MPYCELTGKSWLAGGRVSHSHVRTHRRFNLNMRSVVLRSDVLRRDFTLRITMRALRTLDLYDSFDKFLLSRKSHELSVKARDLKKSILRKMEKDQVAPEKAPVVPETAPATVETDPVDSE